MKKGFSLLELIFAIVVIGVIASFAIPKYLDTRDSAVVSTLKRDVSTAVTSIQAYHLANDGNIAKISDAITLNSKNWTITDSKITDKDACLSIEIKTDDTTNLKTLELIVDQEKTGICTKVRDAGIESATYDLM
jgi:general secretion pathway protein G